MHVLDYYVKKYATGYNIMDYLVERVDWNCIDNTSVPAFFMCIRACMYHNQNFIYVKRFPEGSKRNTLDGFQRILRNCLGFGVRKHIGVSNISVQGTDSQIILMSPRELDDRVRGMRLHGYLDHEDLLKEREHTHILLPAFESCHKDSLMTLGGFTFINDEEFMQAFRGALLESVSHRGNIQGVFI